MIGILVFILAFLYLLCVALPLLRKTEIPKPKNGWKKYDDEENEY